MPQFPATALVPATDTQQFDDAEKALKRINEIYLNSIHLNFQAFKEFAATGTVKKEVNAFYPYIYIIVDSQVQDLDPRLSSGYVLGKGTFGTTVTRPDLFSDYLLEQIDNLLKNHKKPVHVGISETPIPIHFSFPHNDKEFDKIIKQLDQERMEQISEFFAVPDLGKINDNIANGNYEISSGLSAGTPGPSAGTPGQTNPLTIFPAERVDISLQRLIHYTGTAPEHFQKYVLFTNYQFYMDEFVAYGKRMMALAKDKNERNERKIYTEFVEPGEIITKNRNLDPEAADYWAEKKTPPQKQMPAYHLKRKDGSGITMINIGVGPSNAKTITDHVAVLRPNCWLMLGHCAGMRQSQRLGDYVLAHGYLREDQVLDNDLPIQIPIPPLAEVQLALQQAVAECTGFSGYDLKKIMRTGTVATTSNRNWELEDTRVSTHRFSQSRAIAVDMESATIAANGLRFRVPYGTLLCVSDRPVHGQLKLPGMANQFYRDRVNQHLKIGLLSIEHLRKSNFDQLHSRKLRTFTEPAFR